MKRKIKIISIMLASLCFSMFHGYTSNAKVQKARELDSKNVTIITKVLPSGEVVYALACDFGSVVDNSNLSTTSFQVESTTNDKSENRTITKVYTNDVLKTSDISKPGRYVIIELDPNDANAYTLAFNVDTFQNTRNKLNYYVTIKENIKTLNGVNFNASDKKVLDGKEVTPIVEKFKKLVYRDSEDNNLNYRLFSPKVKSNKKYPLVIFLHGTGERGSDNSTQLLGSRGAITFAEPDFQAKNPCYVLAPQAPYAENMNSYWCKEPMNSLLFDLIKETAKKYNIDKNRIYITGVSRGGDGTWNLLEKHPDFFAAGIPICGASDTNYDPIKFPNYSPINPSTVNSLKNIPLWVFHAADDQTVDVRNSREIVAAIKNAGGNLVNYTEYPEGIIKPAAHCSWTMAYENKDALNWLFKQSKNKK
jgi:predicted peptidase